MSGYSLLTTVVSVYSTSSHRRDDETRERKRDGITFVKDGSPISRNENTLKGNQSINTHRASPKTTETQ